MRHRNYFMQRLRHHRLREKARTDALSLRQLGEGGCGPLAEKSRSLAQLTDHVDGIKNSLLGVFLVTRPYLCKPTSRDDAFQKANESLDATR